jgi:hypothetical protein
MFGAFLENGPYFIFDNGTITRNEHRYADTTRHETSTLLTHAPSLLLRLIRPHHIM